MGSQFPPLCQACEVSHMNRVSNNHPLLFFVFFSFLKGTCLSVAWFPYRKGSHINSPSSTAVARVTGVRVRGDVQTEGLQMKYGGDL